MPSDMSYLVHLGPVVVQRCPVTSRPYEDGSGALSHEEQTALFIREAAIAADMPHEGECCLQTGRRYEVGAGAFPKSVQTAHFLNEMPAEFKAQRQAAFEKLRDLATMGSA